MPKSKFYSKTHLFEATKRGDMTALKYYIEKLYMPTAETNKEKQTAAHIAAAKNDFNILKYLVQQDDSVLEFRDINGNTILHLAVQNGSLDMVKFLIDEMNADATAVNKLHSGDSPLHIAAENGHLDILEYLIGEKNVDVNVQNEDGETAIFSAAKRPYMDVIKYMAEKAKANMTATNSKNDNILFVSARVGDLQVPKYLLETLKIDFDLNRQDALGYTLAHIAARSSNLAYLRYLAEERGAALDVGNNEGSTPLHEAALTGSMEVIEYLLGHGANVGRRNRNGKTPFQVASEKQVKKCLSEAMARRDRRSIVPYTPFLHPAVPIAGHEIADAISDRLHGVTPEEPSSDVERDSFHIQSFLVFFSAIARYRTRTWSSSSFINPVCDKIDPVAIDAVTGNVRFIER